MDCKDEKYSRILSRDDVLFGVMWKVVDAECLARESAIKVYSLTNHYAEPSYSFCRKLCNVAINNCTNLQIQS
jgi:hypothetical protein